VCVCVYIYIYIYISLCNFVRKILGTYVKQYCWSRSWNWVVFQDVRLRFGPHTARAPIFDHPSPSSLVATTVSVVGWSRMKFALYIGYKLISHFKNFRRTGIWQRKHE